MPCCFSLRTESVERNLGTSARAVKVRKVVMPHSPLAEQTREVRFRAPTTLIPRLPRSARVGVGEAAVFDGEPLIEVQSHGEPLVEVQSDAESPLEAAAVGPRGVQAVVSGGDLLKSPQCPVGFDLNLSISSDELLKQPSCSRQLSNPSITQSMFSYNHFFY